MAGGLVLSSNLVFDGLLELLQFSGQSLGQVGEVLSLSALLLGKTSVLVVFVGELETHSVGGLDLRGEFFHLSGQIRILGVESSLGRDEVVELTALLISLQTELQKPDFVRLGDSLHLSSGLGLGIQSGRGLVEFPLHLALLLLRSLLLLLQLLDLIQKLLNGVGSLLLQRDELLIELQRSLIEVSLALGELKMYNVISK